MNDTTASMFDGDDRDEPRTGDRTRNTLATPEWLATIATCCICQGPLPEGRRYLCLSCQERIFVS
jgi:hypothetical protein